MNNLQKITQAWKMGWSATVQYTLEGGGAIGQVVTLNDDHFLVIRKGSNADGIDDGWYTGDFVEITGYLYAGELAGNEPIPEGQQFKEKKTGDILNFRRNTITEGLITVSGLTEAGSRFLGTVYKSEIEPHFT